ncbi:hypothetical protein DsansV1_C05g0051801 [Dioscorea sansibarensis]
MQQFLPDNVNIFPLLNKHCLCWSCSILFQGFFYQIMKVIKSLRRVFCCSIRMHTSSIGQNFNIFFCIVNNPHEKSSFFDFPE